MFERSLEVAAAAVGHTVVILGIAAVAIYIGGDLEFGGPLNEVLAIFLGALALVIFFMKVTGWRPRGRVR